MKWSIGTLQTPRGAGLGNEIFAWAKAYIGAKAFNLNMVTPPWKLNRRRYDQVLSGGGLIGSAKYLALSHLPATTITESLYASTGKSDYLDALLALPSRVLLAARPVLKHESGMAGGYLAIRRARPFLRQGILGQAGALGSAWNMGIEPVPTIRIGVHIRGGDFAVSGAVVPSRFNVALPMEWYATVVHSLVSRVGLPVSVYLVSDKPTVEMEEALTIKGVAPVVALGDPAGDLMTMASCDIIVASVSSFSLLAIFLSDARYVWNLDHLGTAGGWGSIWGHEAGTPSAAATRAAAKERSEGLVDGVERGIAQGNKPAWPDHVIQDLQTRALLRNRSFDLALNGVVKKQAE